MPLYLNRPYLRRLRNEIPIAELIVDVLDLNWKNEGDRFRFQCPICEAFNTATNPKTNLGHCFYCKRNFNPIDITMLVKKHAFLDAVEFLDPILKAYLPKTGNLDNSDPDDP